MNSNQIIEEESQFQNSEEIFNDKRIRQAQQQKIKQKQFSDKYSLNVSENIPTIKGSSNQQSAVNKSSQQRIQSLIQKYIEQTIQKTKQLYTNLGEELKIVIRGNSSTKKQKKSKEYISEKKKKRHQGKSLSQNQLIPIQKSKNNEDKESNQSRSQGAKENQSKGHQPQHPLVSNFSFTMQDTLINDECKLSKKSQQYAINLNLDFKDKDNGLICPKKRCYLQQFTERKMQDRQKTSQKIQTQNGKKRKNTTKRLQKSNKEQIKDSSQWQKHIMLNQNRAQMQKKIQSELPQAQSIYLDEPIEINLEKSRMNKDLQIIISQINEEALLGKFQGLDFFIYFSSINKIVSQSGKLYVDVKPFGLILTTFQRNQQFLDFLKLLGSYLRKK